MAEQKTGGWTPNVSRIEKISMKITDTYDGQPKCQMDLGHTHPPAKFVMHYKEARFEVCPACLITSFASNTLLLSSAEKDNTFEVETADHLATELFVAFAHRNNRERMQKEAKEPDPEHHWSKETSFGYA